jgi:hypothetical protein
LPRSLHQIQTAVFFHCLELLPCFSPISPSRWLRSLRQWAAHHLLELHAEARRIQNPEVYLEPLRAAATTKKVARPTTIRIIFLPEPVKPHSFAPLPRSPRSATAASLCFFAPEPLSPASPFSFAVTLRHCADQHSLVRCLPLVTGAAFKSGAT